MSTTDKIAGGGYCVPETIPDTSIRCRAGGCRRHYQMIDRYISQKGLSKDEFYDVVALGYLLAVKKWFNRPDLYRYEFSTIAWAAMRSAVTNERRRQARRVKTVSLNDPIPGTDGMTWEDIVTEKHLIYSA